MKLCAEYFKTIIMEKFSLKWNDFEKNVSRTFISLRKQENLQDVTLVGRDQRQVSAHRLVLSACSEFFKNIFNTNSQSNLVLYLEGVTSEELSLVLDYMYQGEVQIYQDKLDRFLDISKKYELNGLNVEETENYDYTTENKSASYKEENTMTTNLPNDLHEEKSKEASMRLMNFPNETFIANNSEVDDKYEELVVRDNDVWRCTVCGRTNKYRCNMKRHLETHLTGLSYECNVCQKSFRSSHALACHKSTYHLKKTH